jgi:hypothetical protein
MTDFALTMWPALPLFAWMAALLGLLAATLSADYQRALVTGGCFLFLGLVTIASWWWHPDYSAPVIGVAIGVPTTVAFALIPRALDRADEQ